MFLKVKDVAKRYNIATSTVRTAVKLGMFPRPLQIGKTMRWNLETLQAYEKAAYQGINAYDAQIDDMTDAEFESYEQDKGRTE